MAFGALVLPGPRPVRRRQASGNLLVVITLQVPDLCLNETE
jgi:hypothetical protein